MGNVNYAPRHLAETSFEYQVEDAIGYMRRIVDSQPQNPRMANIAGREILQAYNYEVLTAAREIVCAPEGVK